MKRIAQIPSQEFRYCVLSFFLSFLSLFPTLWRGPSSWGYGLPRFCVAPRVGDKDSHAFAWPLELGLRTPTLLRGPSSWGYGLRRFCVAP